MRSFIKYLLIFFLVIGINGCSKQQPKKPAVVFLRNAFFANSSLHAIKDGRTILLNKYIMPNQYFWLSKFNRIMYLKNNKLISQQIGGKTTVLASNIQSINDIADNQINILISLDDENFSLYILNRITKKRSLISRKNHGASSFSSDGSKIAFEENGSLVLKNLDDSKKTILVQSPKPSTDYVTAVEWSPDEKYIAYTYHVLEPDEHSSLYLYDLNASKPIKKTSNIDVRHIKWLDKKTIIFNSAPFAENSAGRIDSLDVTNNKIKTVAENDTSSASISKDKKIIYSGVDKKGKAFIWIKDNLNSKPVNTLIKGQYPIWLD